MRSCSNAASDAKMWKIRLPPGSSGRRVEGEGRKQEEFSKIRPRRPVSTGTPGATLYIRCALVRRRIATTNARIIFDRPLVHLVGEAHFGGLHSEAGAGHVQVPPIHD